VGHAVTFAVNAALVASRNTAREAFPCTLPLTLSTRLHLCHVPAKVQESVGRDSFRFYVLTEICLKS